MEYKRSAKSDSPDEAAWRTYVWCIVNLFESVDISCAVPAVLCCPALRCTALPADRMWSIVHSLQHVGGPLLVHAARRGPRLALAALYYTILYYTI